MSREPESDFAAKLAEIPDFAAESVPTSEPVAVLPAAPTRRQIRLRRLAALVGSGAWLGFHLAVFGVRTDWAELPLPYIAAQILLPFGIACASLLIALGRGRLGLGLRVGVVSGLAVLGPVSFCLIAAGAPPPRAVTQAASSVVGSVLCFDITLAWVAIPLLAAAAVLRGAFAAAGRFRSALIGAAIGLFVGATMNLHCPNVAPSHMLFGHGLAVVVAALAGALALVHLTRA